ncbi:MAG: SpaH/EbpB family LPXTG-anchored major pilin [Lachnospiraceae bacterium]|nr:SpaH/EbpB family LPXTG-anchored major pilin [Lachnospiraceae bacterium]
MKKTATSNKKPFGKVMLTLLMCLIMAVGALPGVSVKATSTAPVMDPSQTGSITIHKYEYNAPNPSPTPIAGTGEAGQAVPEGAKALEGAGFTLYKIVGKNAIANYYNGITPEPLPTDINDYCEQDATTKRWKLKSGASTLATITEQKTDASGETKFEDLEAGIYLVIETTTPDKVTTPVTPFFVSIPMTKSTGSGWLYDVHVYPKNATTYSGDIELKKLGTGTNTLTGVTFVLQKEKDDGTYQTLYNNDKGDPIGPLKDPEVTNSAGHKEGTGVLTTGNDGCIKVNGLSQGTYRFVETGLGPNYGYILDGATGYEFTVDASGQATYQTTTTTNEETLEIEVTNEKPDVEKKIKNPTPSPMAYTGDYTVGDTVTYQIAVDVPKNVENLGDFRIEDTPNNLKYTSNTLKVYKADGTTEIAASTYTLNESAPANGFTITFTTGAENGIKESAGEQIFIEYKAVLQNTAILNPNDDDNIGGNVNKVELFYSNEIRPTGTDDGNPNYGTPTPTPYVIEDSGARVYSFKINILKTGDNSAKLAGVKFDLYREVASGTDGSITGDDAKALGLDSTKSWEKVQTLTTDSNGEVGTTGLANGTYYLVETETNAGYNLLSKPVKVELEFAYNIVTVTPAIAAGRTTKGTLDEENSYVTPGVSIDDATATNSIEVNIKNSKGFTLPTTGGAGGFLFTLVGCGIMIVGIVIFHRTRNKKAENA